MSTASTRRKKGAVRKAKPAEPPNFDRLEGWVYRIPQSRFGKAVGHEYVTNVELCLQFEGITESFEALDGCYRTNLSSDDIKRLSCRVRALAAQAMVSATAALCLSERLHAFGETAEMALDVLPSKEDQ